MARGEVVEVQVDRAVYAAPFAFTFRPMRRNESVFLYRGRVMAAFDEAYNAHAHRYGLITGPGAPFDSRYGNRKRGAKWVKPEPLAKVDGPDGAPMVPNGGTITVSWGEDAAKIFKL